jgi:hypothetical protein
MISLMRRVDRRGLEHDEARIAACERRPAEHRDQTRWPIAIGTMSPPKARSVQPKPPMAVSPGR